MKSILPLVALALVPPLLGAAPAATAPAPVRALTFNLRYANAGDGPDRWEARRDTVATVIAREADIAATQEGVPPQMAELAARLPDFAVVSRTREVSPAKGECCAVWFRKDRFEATASGTFWLSDTPDVPGSKSWGNDLPRTCTWVVLKDKAAGCSIRVFGVHLDHQSAEARKRGAALVAARAAAQPGTTLVMGDFNEQWGGPACGAFAAASGWQEGWHAAGAGEGGTFNGWREQGRFGHIDFIFVREGKVRSARVLREKTPAGRWASDHFPVQTVVEWATGAGG